MLHVVKPLLFALIFLLEGCVVYPTTRTFYEVNPDDGTPKNRMSCGYTLTKDSVQRVIQGVTISISPGEEEVQTQVSSSLKVWVSYSYLAEGPLTKLDTSKIQIETLGKPLAPAIVRLNERTARYSEGFRFVSFIELLYPPPAGLDSQIRFIFLPDALQINGVNVPVAPFRFTRVKKSDVYYGSINC